MCVAIVQRHTGNIPCLQNEVLLSVLVRVSIPAQTSRPRRKLRRKGFIQLPLPLDIAVHHQRKSGLELK